MHGHVTAWHCNDAWSHDRASLQCCMVNRHVHHSIMTNVAWQRFDQSVKQLAAGHTTNTSDMIGEHLANSEMNATKIKQIHCRNCLVNGRWRLELNITKTSTDNRHTINREQKCAENYNKQHNEFIFLQTAISILVILNYSSFQVLFKLLSYILYLENIFTF